MLIAKQTIIELDELLKVVVNDLISTIRKTLVKHHHQKQVKSYFPMGFGWQKKSSDVR